MLLLKVVVIIFKCELNELTITSVSLIMMPFIRMEGLDVLCYLPIMVLMLNHAF